MKRFSIAFLLLLLTLSACRSSAPLDGLPTTTRELITVIPTPSEQDKATITGVLLTNRGAPSPVAGVILYLAEIVPEAQGTPFLAGFERTTSPRTLTDLAGRFVFADVLPDQYSLVLDWVYQAFLLDHPETGSDFIFEPQPGQVLDLGNLVYETIPGGTPAP